MDDAPLAEHTTCRAAEARGLELAGHLNAVNAALTAYTADLIATDTWVQGAATTPSAFLQWKLGLSPARADDTVRSPPSAPISRS